MWTAGVVVLLLLIVRVILPASDLAWLPGSGLCAALAALGLMQAWTCRRAPEDAPWRRDPGTGALVAALAVLVSTLLAHDFRLTSDGVDHFVYLRSLWVDGDLDLANDYERVSPRGVSIDPPTPLGRTGNLHPIGPALVWSPFYMLADLLTRATGRPPDGDGPLYRNAVALAGLLAGWLGLVCLYRALIPPAGRGAALLAALGVGFGTFLYWYLAFAPTMAHAPAFAAGALVLALWLSPQPSGTRRAALLGAACGAAALLRWTNVLLVLLPAIEWLPRLRRRAEWQALARESVVFALCGLAAFAQQMIVWRLLYGSFLTIPQGSAFVAGEPAYAGVLFSPHHGLFSWSPLLYLGLLGVLLFAWRAPLRGLALLALLVALIRVNAGVADWWGGAAFGARRFDGALPALGLGLALALRALAELFQRRPLLLPALLSAAVVAWNLLLARSYSTGTWDYAGPVAFEQMGHAAVSEVDRAVGSPFALPGSLWEWLRTGRAPADYESLFMERPHARWSIRMGLDERMFLEDGWSAPVERGGTCYRAIVGESAGLVIPLHRAVANKLGARLVLDPGLEGARRVRVLVNQRVVGSWQAGAQPADGELEVAAELWRPGRNTVRLRLLDGPGGVAVAGLWLEPARGTSTETTSAQRLELFEDPRQR